MADLSPLTTQDVAELRRCLWRAGFRPVALRTNDKMPLSQGWQHHARLDPPRDAEDYPQRGLLNTGILGDGLRIIDLDVEDVAVVEALRRQAEALLGHGAPVRTRGNSPRAALLYRAADGAPGKRSIGGMLGKVEVLGFGQQLHAFGRHPSGANLHWHPAPPGTVRHGDLPEATEQQIAAFLVAAAPLIVAVAASVPMATRRGPEPARVPDDNQIRALIRFVAKAHEAERNNRLYWAGCRMAGFVASGLLSAAAAEALLMQAALHAGLPETEARRTARSGLTTGRAS